VPKRYITGNGSFGIRSAATGLYSIAPLRRLFPGAIRLALAAIAVLSMYRVDSFYSYQQAL